MQQVKNWLYAVLASYTLTSLLLLSSCGGSTAAAPSGSPLTAVPALGEITHGTSSYINNHGCEFDPLFSHNVTADGEDAVFTPSWSRGQKCVQGLAFALYRIQVPPDWGEAAPGFEMDPQLVVWWRENVFPEAGTAFAGISNWETGCWEWYPVGQAQMIDLRSTTIFAPYSKPGTEEMLVIMVCLGEPARLKLIGAPDAWVAE